MESKIIMAASVFVLFALPAFAGVADFGPKKNILILNSANYEDAACAAAYSAQNGYDFAFIITPTHGEYWLSLLSNSQDNVEYYQSSNPVHAPLGGKLSALSRLNIKVHNSPDPCSEFAAMQNSASAIVVGRQSGPEAISAASYAAISGASLYFADGANADVVVSELAGMKQSVLVYGSIANSVSEQELAEVSSINSGSIYLDNAKMLSLYAQLKAPSQAIFASGKEFEAEMISKDYPAALVGRTEPSQNLLDWITSSGVKSGLVFSGDADISASIATIKRETGLPVFAKLGQGFAGDSQMQPLAMLPVPSKNVMLSVNLGKYSTKSGAFELSVKNTGESVAYVRAAASLPSGELGSSQLVKIEPSQQATLEVPLAIAATSGSINQAQFQIYSGSDQYVTESIDAITFMDIPIDGQTGGMSLITNYTEGLKNPQEYAQAQGELAISSVIALVLMLVAAYLFMHKDKRGSHVVLSKGTHHSHSHWGRRRS
ncbi:MAG: hypothetical protein V1822_04360 [Candidatus Micrarchaeota archaeon]